VQVVAIGEGDGPPLLIDNDNASVLSAARCVYLAR
jgi:hypothetical protein